MPFVFFLLLVVSPVFATEVKEIETSCELFDCYTILEITDLKPSDIALYKDNLGNFITKKEAYSLDKTMTKPIQNTIKMDSFVWDKINTDRVTIRGKIDGATNNYWGISNIWNSTWWNSTYRSRTELNISRYNFNGVEPIFANLTTFMNNTYGARLIDDNNNSVNYTMLRYDEVGVIEWIYIVFPYNNASNLTYNWYFNASTETDDGLLFALFVPDDLFYESCDFSNDWKTNDEAKYQCGNGNMTAIPIDSGQIDSDQLQTLTDFSSYLNITVWNVINYPTSANDAEYSRFLAGTRVLETHDNGLGVLVTEENPDEYRVFYNFGEGGAVDSDSGVDVNYDDNVSIKVWYNSGLEDAMLWIANKTDLPIHSINTTALNQDVKYWGFWSDENSDNFYVHEFFIFLGYVNPTITNRATVSQGGVEVNDTTPVTPAVNLTNGTYINYSCSGNYSLKNTTTIGDSNTTTLDYIYCSNGCNEANLMITIWGNEASFCNPEIWVQVIMFIVFVVVLIYVIRRIS